jgi:hypothetical protein
MLYPAEDIFPLDELILMIADIVRDGLVNRNVEIQISLIQEDYKLRMLEEFEGLTRVFGLDIF